MFVVRMGSRQVPFAAAVVAALGCASSALAQSPAVLFYEDFGDATLNPNAVLFVNEDSTAVVESGVAVVNDLTDRSGFSVVQTFDEPLMTFQFDFVQPVVPNASAEPPMNRMEVVLRAGIGDAHRTLQSADHVVEAIAFRGTDATGSRLGEMIENKTLFLAYNNKDTDQTFISPVDGVTETLLTPYQYVPFAFDRTTMTFTAQPKGVSNANLMGGTTFPPADMTRFAIGSSTSNDQGTFAIDNVLVRAGLVFDREFPDLPPPTLIGDFDGDMDVDGDDLAIWRTNFGSDNSEADADGDGDSDGNDFLLWQRHVGQTASVQAVPEASTLSLAAFALTARIGSSRRRRGASS